MQTEEEDDEKEQRRRKCKEHWGLLYMLLCPMKFLN